MEPYCEPIGANKPYRCKPLLHQSIIINDKLADLDGTYLQFYHLDNYQLLHSKKVIEKGDQYCAKLSVLSDQILVIFGVCKFILFNSTTYEIIENVQINGFIEAAETRNGYIATLTTEEDGQMKLINCWKVNQTNGKITNKFQSVEFNVPQFENCTEENISIALIISILNEPKLYVYWKNTSEIIEVDPIKLTSVRFSRSKTVNFLVDIDKQSYAQVSGTKIYITSKREGKQIAQLTNQKEKYHYLTSNQHGNFLCSISDKGIKKWQIKQNSIAQLYTQSQQYPIEKLYFTRDGRTIGINTEQKNILIWNNLNQCKISHFPLEIVRRILKYNPTQICLLLEATADSEQEGQHRVTKYNKLEIYDFVKDIDVAKKAVKKKQYQIDIASAVVCQGSQGSSIRFILNEVIGETKKKYMFRWSPFVEDKKKQIKKREIVGTKQFDIIKIYSFDRILAVMKPKDMQTYSVFSQSENKTQISLYDFSAKNFGNYDINEVVKDVEMNSENHIYIIANNKLSIYTIDIGQKNRLEKIHYLEVSIDIVYPISSSFLLLRNENSFMLYDKEFDIILKQSVDPEDKQFRILKVDNNKFILKTEKSYSLWDLNKEEIKQLKGLPEISPSHTELMDDMLIASDKWILAYNLKDDLNEK